MALNRTAPRHGLTYLRRRPRRGEPTTTPVASAPSSLDLGARAPQRPTSRTPPARPVDGRTILTKDRPVATLNRRQSAIGSLVFTLHGAGALGCCWELTDGESGLVSAATGVHVSPEFARRPIVELLDGPVVVGLRHAEHLRRLLVLAAELPDAPGSRVIADLVDGATVEIAPAAAAPVVAVLAAYRVDGRLIVRREDAGFPTADAAATAYGFAQTWLPPVQRRPPA